MMEMYNGHHYWGMHLIWWFVWVFLIFWIFAIPYNIPGQRAKKYTPLDILKKRFALGEINENEYQEKKKRIED